MKVEIQKNILNLWLSTYHGHSRGQYSKWQTNVNYDTGSVGGTLFLLKRIFKNILTIFFIVLFSPVILLSGLDAYLDNISDNRISKRHLISWFVNK